MKKYKLIDVSCFMTDFTFPGDRSVEISGPFNVVKGTNREYVYEMILSSQSGTHIQGPHYFLENGKRIEKFPMSSFEGEAVIVDIKKRGSDTTKTDFISKLNNVDLSGKILILRSGHMDEVIRKKLLIDTERPGISLDAAKYLAEEKKIRMIAIDSVGVESRVSENYEVNKYLCEQEILILEGLINLKSVSSDKVFLEALPLKIKGVEGTPCRAVIKVFRGHNTKL